jgi:RNA polymerase sigma-70 factor (ECF subfamily)
VPATLRASASSNVRVTNADATRFEALYREHASRLFNVAWRMCGCRTEAEDLLQDIFLLAYRKLAEFRGESAIGTWLYRVAMNRCLDHLKSAETRARRATASLDDELPAIACKGRTSRDDEITKMDLERAIGQLPDGARAVFLLHDVEGFQHQEIAAILGISEGTSKSQVHKARLRVRAALRGIR